MIGGTIGDTKLRLLILGGTTEASALAFALAGDARVTATLSLAGRTENPDVFPIPTRVGGFGGRDGLAQYLRTQRIDAVVDATHPFAAQISENAVAACAATQRPLAVFSRPEWAPTAADRWTSAADMAAAAAALGATPRRVFLTVGRLALGAFAVAPQHYYLIRTIDAFDASALFPWHRLIRARGPFSLESETALMREARIDCLVTKNSGGEAGAAKLAAARALGLEVIIVRRPPASRASSFLTLEAVLAWIAHHRRAP